MRQPDIDGLWCDFGQNENLTTRIKQKSSAWIF